MIENYAACVSERMKDARKSAGLNITQFSQLAGMNPSRISLIETGQSVPDLASLILYARATGKQPREFLPDIIQAKGMQS